MACSVELVGDDATNDVPDDHTNLAFIAAEKLMVRAGRSGHGVRLVLRKQIPAGAGLGGGSADAAAALLAVRRLLEIDVDDDGVREIAAEIGSDVSFCLRGGAAWMRGRGEIIERSRSRTGSPSSSRSRRSGCRRPTCTRRGTSSVARARRDGARAAPRRPVPARAGQRPRARGGSGRAAPRGVPHRRSRPRPASPALLAGSGSAYVVPVPDARALPGLVDEVGHRLRVPVVGTTSVSRGVRLA